MQSLDCRGASFEQWVKAVFAHPVTANEWYWDCDFYEPDDATSVAYMTKLFCQPELLEEYLDDQVNQGLYFLISNSCSNHIFALYNESVPLQKRVACIESFSDLFEKVFAVRCSAHLSHLDEAGVKPLNHVCYMWWDVIPLYGRPAEPAFTELDQAALRVMEKGLASASLACQESSLHGLGHWHMHYPQRTEQIIDGFLRKPVSRRSELTAYAQAARSGCVN